MLFISIALCSQIESCVKYWNEYGQNISLLDELAICFSQGCSFQEGLVWNKKMVNKYPRNFKFLFGMGIMEGNHRRFREALHCLEQAENLAFFPKISIIKAFIFQNINIVLLFRKLVLLAVESNPPSRSLLFLKLKFQMFEKGKQYQPVQKMMDKYPGYIEPILLMASYYRYDRNYTKAIQLYNNCLPRFQYNQFVRIKLGICFAWIGEYERALQYLDYQRAKNSNSTHLLFDLALISQYRWFCFYKLGEYHQACYWFDDKSKQFGNDLIEKDLLLAPLLLCLKEMKRYSRIVELGLQYMDTKLNMCQQELIIIFSTSMHACVQIKYFQYAETIAKRGCQLMKNGFCFEELARIYETQGKLADALHCCTVCCQEGYSRYQNVRKGAEILEKLELYQQSISAFQKCYQLTKSEEEHKWISQKLQQIRNKQKPSQQ